VTTDGTYYEDRVLRHRTLDVASFDVRGARKFKNLKKWRGKFDVTHVTIISYQTPNYTQLRVGILWLSTGSKRKHDCYARICIFFKHM
jgi:hypothetical protein